MDEIWKDVKNYESLYQVSNFGRIKSLPKVGSTKELIRKTRIDFHTGYETVQLRKNNLNSTVSVHKLVADAFLIKPESSRRLCVNHLDGVKHNNKLENLEWSTYSENVKHAYSLGLAKPVLGEKQPLAQLKNCQICDIKKLFGKMKVKDIAAQYNVSKSIITKIKIGRTWKHIICNDIV